MPTPLQPTKILASIIVALLIGTPMAAEQVSAKQISAKPVTAKQQSIKRGENLAAKLCSKCHSITTKGVSKHGKAPPFRSLSKKYPLEHLEEALAEGIVVGHDVTDMPTFALTPDQIQDFLNFVKSISK